MTHMYFIDTSVLLDILDVPRHCTPKGPESKKKLTAILSNNSEKVSIPLAVIIETGNFINHIKKQSERISCEKRFIEILEFLVDDQNDSWNLSDHEYTLADLNNIITTANNLFPSQIGIGDAFIIESYNSYCNSFCALKDYTQRFPTEIWSYDKHINWYKNY